jgi:hypothetical protein
MVSGNKDRNGTVLAGIALFLLQGCGNATVDFFNPDLGLLAHWALDEGQPGSVVADSSSFGNNGKPSPNPPVPTTDVPPVRFPDPHALTFNGQDQWVDMGNPGLLNAGGPVTVAAWVRPAKIDSRSNIVAHGYRFNPNYDLALRIDAGEYVFTMWDDLNHQATSPIPPTDIGTWVHLCGVFDGATYWLYRNGVLADSTADLNAPQANVDTPWAIGARLPIPTSGSANLFQGAIDDVRIYGRALHAEEIQALYRR